MRQPRAQSQPHLFSEYDKKATQQLFSVQAYLRKYGKDPDGLLDLQRNMEEFDDWTIDVCFGDEVVQVLCCPEDRECCSAKCLAGKALCESCRVPVCQLCFSYTNAASPSLPPPSLANDMMIFYAPEDSRSPFGIYDAVAAAGLFIPGQAHPTGSSSSSNSSSSSRPFAGGQDRPGRRCSS